ncbi:MAG: hypothetical protein LBQ60_09760 [Bacteroidales bacterium]|jgi:hypothetical protein|nr:hypothetical protein [Bacteroidales bacterium]
MSATNNTTLVIHHSFFESIKNYLLIDGLSVAYTGLSGKAGAALALFELSREDAFLENYAFEFFQESLAFLNNDYSYKGVVGVGMILDYLIDNQFIDADFGELFGESHEQIVKQVLSESYLKDNICDLLLYFLSVNKIPDSNNECIHVLLDHLPDAIRLSSGGDINIQKKWRFIITNYAKDPRLHQFVYDSDRMIDLQSSDISDEGSTGLMVQVDRLFRAISTKTDTKEVIDTIIRMKLNFDEQDFNLSISRLLILLSNIDQVPSRLLFFFY